MLLVLDNCEHVVAGVAALVWCSAARVPCATCWRPAGAPGPSGGGRATGPAARPARSPGAGVTRTIG
jgi:hypothetical protein